ncbi:Aldo/keto reductase [Fomitopsis serialis]|uniref:Aldo/keto reductase n=1 Tax=Fomitopsis serialis TaxID=139415 RepID=UPI002008DACA|nr:Aldo/keto reductase [Neoantrodia serialis]KAH9922112.1 Aldo/keto reductase [Neoantrodia serialis]
MSHGKVLSLSSGQTIPQIGLGTWLSKPNEVENAVELAVRAGYRHLDLAMIYANQDEVGRALKKVVPSVVKREELFITSKLWNTSHKKELVEKELDETLSQLGTDYLDLYLIHWPVAFKGSSVPGKDFFPSTKEGWVELDTETSLVETWQALIDLIKTGKVKAIGVSNFTIEQIQTIADATGVWPTVNQIEAHPLLQQDELDAFAKAHNIHITAYSPLGNNLVGKPKLTDYPEVVEIAKKLDATPAQVLVAYGVYRGYSVIPKSVQKERIDSNLKQVSLSEEDYQKLVALGKRDPTRFNVPYNYSPRWDINIFNEPSEQPATTTPKLK